MRGRGGSQLPTGGDEPLLHFRERLAQGGGTRGQHEVEPGGHEVLVLAEHFAEAPLGAVAQHGVVADGGLRGDHAHAGGRRVVRRGPGTPDQEERAAIGAATMLARGAEVAIALHALRGAEALRRRRRVSAGHGERKSDDGEALAALAATGSEDFAAAFGGLAGAETDLASALLAVRTECRLHGFVKKRGSKSVEAPGGVKRRDCDPIRLRPRAQAAARYRSALHFRPAGMRAGLPAGGRRACEQLARSFVLRRAGADAR